MDGEVLVAVVEHSVPSAKGAAFSVAPRWSLSVFWPLTLMLHFARSAIRAVLCISLTSIIPLSCTASGVLFVVVNEELFSCRWAVSLAKHSSLFGAHLNPELPSFPLRWRLR